MADTPGSVNATGRRSVLVVVEEGSDVTQERIGAISTKLTNTLQDLAELWADVGYMEDEKQRQLDALFEELSAVCDRKAAEETKIKEHVQSNIDALKDEIALICVALAADPPEVVLHGKTAGGGTMPMNLTDQLAQLEPAAEVLRVRRDERMAELTVLMEKAQKIGDELGVPTADDIDDDDDSDLSEMRVERLQALLSGLEEKMEQRVEDMKDLAQKAYALMKDTLRMPFDERMRRASSLIDGNISSNTVPEADDDRINITTLQKYTRAWCEDEHFQFTPHATTLQALQDLYASLEDEKNARSDRLGDMGVEIQGLWTLLEIPIEEQQAFSSTCQALGLSIETIERGEAELHRLRELKKERMGEVARKKRSELSTLWDVLGLNEEQRAAFSGSAVPDDECNDDTLQAFDDEIARVAQLVESMAPILKKVELREEIVTARRELDELQKDPARLTARGPKARENRKKEEQMARRVRALKKISDDLVSRITEWEAQSEQPLMFQGIRYLEHMEQTEAAYEQSKENEKAARAQKKRLEREGRHNASTFAPPLKQQLSAPTLPSSSAAAASASAAAAALNGSRTAGGTPLKKGVSDSSIDSTRKQQQQQQQQQTGRTRKPRKPQQPSASTTSAASSQAARARHTRAPNRAAAASVAAAPSRGVGVDENAGADQSMSSIATSSSHATSKSSSRRVANHVATAGADESGCGSVNDSIMSVQDGEPASPLAENRPRESATDISKASASASIVNDEDIDVTY